MKVGFKGVHVHIARTCFPDVLNLIKTFMYVICFFVVQETSLSSGDVRQTIIISLCLYVRNNFVFIIFMRSFAWNWFSEIMLVRAIKLSQLQ